MIGQRKYMKSWHPIFESMSYKCPIKIQMKAQYNTTLQIKMYPLKGSFNFSDINLLNHN